MRHTLTMMVNQSIYIAIIASTFLMLSSCFTGVESTPKITRQDVEKERIVVSPEQKFLSGISPQNPNLWRRGKSFYVSDEKAKLLFSADRPLDSISLKGSYIHFDSLKKAMSFAGEEVAQFIFSADGGTKLSYMPGVEYSELEKRKNFEIPFLIDMDMVRAVKDSLKGHTYFITTPVWQTADGSSQRRVQRHVPVTVQDVVPGNSFYPFRIIFIRPGSSEPYSLLMTIGDSRTATQNFHTLFAFDNPRLHYPKITDETWQLIINSKIRIGMTKDECRLALGTPNVRGERPTTAGMVEYWQYSDGTFLIFEEGLLSVIR